MSGRTAPPKPWENRAGASNGSSGTATPLGPSTPNDGAAKPWEQAGGAVAGPEVGAVANRSRPWESGGPSTSGYGLQGGYGPGSSYGGGYGGGYNSGYGSSYGGGYGMGSSMYSRPAYGGYGSGYGGGYGSSYGGGAYGGGYMNRYGPGYGGSYGMSGGYGMGGYGGMGGFAGGYGPGVHPGDPGGHPPPPPSAWQHMLHAIGGVVGFFGRLSFLVDENAHAFHFFISSLLQLLDRAGSLYGELARFVLRLLGYGSRSKQRAAAGAPALPPAGHGQAPAGQAAGPGLPPGQHRLPGLPAPRSTSAAAAADSTSFDSLWKA